MRAFQRACGAHTWRPVLGGVTAAGPGTLRGLAGSGRTYDVVVVGAGVIGSSCSLELRKLGYSTLNVDSNPSPGYGSTSSSSAIVRHFYSFEDSCRLAWEGYHCWKAWADHLEAAPGEDLCVLHEIGCAAVDAPASPAARTYISRVRNSMKACSIPCEEWDLPEIRRRMPYLSTTSYFPPRRIDDDAFGADTGGEIAGLLFCPHAGYVNDPQLAARNVTDAVIRRGGDYRWRAHVVQINCNASGSKVSGVTLQDGSVIEAPIIVNAAGPHSQAVHDLAFAGAGVADDSLVSSKPLKVEVAYLQEPPGSCIDDTMPVIADMDVGVYMRPQMGGQLLVGSVEPECDDLHFIESADHLIEGLSDEWTNIVYRAALRLPSLQVPNTASGLAALYDTTPDWSPIYDRSALRGFYCMRGTSGNQFKNAPVAGRICANIVDGCENGHDHDAMPLTLPLQHVAGSINLGLFSRRREGGGTTGTVLG
mmetsp:Transcript_96472/g.241942  ORF Transcript_96472/g.241942 Transcript_96472/m.241942 type:complete len:478 (+) Transcript_96472:57-1490(+)